MNKTIKIIDLLNKIANGEKVPKRIKLRGFELYRTLEDGKRLYIDDEKMFFPEHYTFDLNDTVEIIEDNDKLEKINVKTGDNCKRFIEYDDKTGHHKYTIRLLDEYFAKNINKIIDHINKIEEKLDER